MAAPPDKPLSYEMRHRTTWMTYLFALLGAAATSILIIAGGVRGLPVTISVPVLCAVGALIQHRRENGRLLFRVDERGIQVGSDYLFVAWPNVLNADLGYDGEDRSLMFRVRRGSVVPLSERGERTARKLNGPPSRWSRSPSQAELSVGYYVALLDRAALTAVIRAHAPHVTGRFGSG